MQRCTNKCLWPWQMNHAHGVSLIIVDATSSDRYLLLKLLRSVSSSGSLRHNAQLLFNLSSKFCSRRFLICQLRILITYGVDKQLKSCPFHLFRRSLRDFSIRLPVTWIITDDAAIFSVLSFFNTHSSWRMDDKSHVPGFQGFGICAWWCCSESAWCCFHAHCSFLYKHLCLGKVVFS